MKNDHETKGGNRINQNLKLNKHVKSSVDIYKRKL